jgi:IS30 family transposase
MIRRFIPKGQPITFISQVKINQVQKWINEMPREMFNYKSANDLYNIRDYIAKIESNLYR